MDTKTNRIRYISETFVSPLRFVGIMTVVVAAYDTGRAVLSFLELVRTPDMDILLVLLWLLTAPLTFGASVCFFYAAKKIYDGQGADLAITIAFGLMILSSVANLISQASILNGKAISILVLCGVTLICYVIGFLYFQGIGTRLMAMFAGGLGVACATYYLVIGIRLVLAEPQQILGYLFTSYLTATMIAMTTLLAILSLGVGIPTEIDDSDK